MIGSGAAGFYGKVPTRGDFVSRRLPWTFVDPWDRWLQGGLACSRDQLGDAWLEVYLTSPVWRFALTPGVCGDAGWIGIVLPSVDRVGRYFPLTVARPWTGTDSAVAAYEFTTLTVVPGALEHKGAKIQLLDMPGLIAGAAMGKGWWPGSRPPTRSSWRW